MESHAPGNSLTYRPEIDGLRALAVVSVILYHAGMLIPGGYVGVDVFFVISGFLIASIVIREKERGTFRLAGFWERRLRRLFPAWIAMIVVTTVAALILLIPDHLEDYGESLLSQPSFSANFHFWERSGYFEPESGWQPLLHTWSLAVEEQFYLFFPLILPPLLAKGRRIALLVVALLGLASFALCLYTTSREPEFAFYLLPARIWELNFGVLLALAPGLAAGFGPKTRELLGAAGLVLIGVALFLFGPNTPFPGSAALLPCLGTALVILANTQGLTRTGRWLAAPPFVAIGRISYPLYLWHWPCLALLTYGCIDDAPLWATYLMVAFSFVLAWLTYRWIEKPVRDRRRLATSRSLLLVTGIAVIGVVAAALIFTKSGGLPGRFPDLGRFGIDEIFRPKVATIEQWDDKGGPPRLGDLAATGPGILVWGDSHALALTRLFDELGKTHHVKVTVASMAGVAPVVGAYPAGRGADELVHAERVIELVKAERFREVILVAKWPMYLTGRSGGELDRILRDGGELSDEPEEAIEVFLRHFPATLETLSSLGCRVTVMGAVPQQPHRVPEALARIVIRGETPEALAWTAAIHRERDRKENEIVAQAVAGTGAVLLDPLPVLTDEAGMVPMIRQGKALYMDRDHLSPYGSMLLMPLFEELFRTAGAGE